jgi:GAF domain-containing protein
VEVVSLRNDQGSVIGLLPTHFGSEAIPSERRLALFELCAQHATQLIETRQSEQNLRAEVTRLAQRNADLERIDGDFHSFKSGA